MKHTGEGSSSNQQPAEEGSPRQNSGDGEGNVRRGHGRGRSHPPFLQPRALPQMGRAGFSAFTPYRPLGPPPRGNFPAASSGAAAGVSRSRIIEVAQAVPVAVVGSSGSSLAAVGNQFGDSIVRKRDIGHAEGGENPFRCSVCSKSFRSSKALFGHLRLHPNRGWKGAFPPPSFKAEEDFADIPILNQNAAAGGVGQMVEGVADGGGNAPASAEGSAEGGDGSDAIQYKVPDLNFSPLSDTDEE